MACLFLLIRWTSLTKYQIYVVLVTILGIGVKFTSELDKDVLEKLHYNSASILIFAVIISIWDLLIEYKILVGVLLIFGWGCSLMKSKHIPDSELSDKDLYYRILGQNFIADFLGALYPEFTHFRPSTQDFILFFGTSLYTLFTSRHERSMYPLLYTLGSTGNGDWMNF